MAARGVAAWRRGGAHEAPLADPRLAGDEHDGARAVLARRDAVSMVSSSPSRFEQHGST